MRKWKKIIIGGVLAFTSLALVGLVRSPDIYFLIKKNFTIFSEVYREVSLHYVDEIDPETLMRKGISAMTESLDPYTELIDETENQDLEIMTRGSYGGVGLDVGYRDNKIVVIAPVEGYSAHSKGIRSGDVIIAVDGISVKDMAPEQVQNLTTGEPGTAVTLTIQRFGSDHPLKFDLERERIEVKNVTYSGFVGADKKVGYILLSRFSQNAAQEIQNTLEDLQSQKDISGLVLDVRNNPGGLLEESVNLVDKFVPQDKTVVETRGRFSQHNNSFKTKETPIASDLPLVVLQNNGSASASEIVAGALQDFDRAVIVGEQSFGKGLVQIMRPLSYNTTLKLTASRYYIPSGRSIQSVTYTHDENNSAVKKPDSSRKKFTTEHGRTVYDGNGIAPDIEISSSDPTFLQTALMQQNMFFEFANQYAVDHDSLVATMGSNILYSEFKEFLAEENFEYEIPSEDYLAKIDSSLKGKTTNHTDHIKDLKQSIEKMKKGAFEEQRSEIERLLFLELLARYKGKQGQTSASLPYDHMVEEAVDILHDVSRYNEILSIQK